MAKRGRPKIIKEQIDAGTMELQKKRKAHLTSEPLDLCLEYNIISEDQHRYALRLRWLYTLRFGVPTVQSYDLTRINGIIGSKYNDEKWISKKQQEYREILQILGKIRAVQIVQSVCIHHMYPIFLDKFFFRKLQSVVLVKNIKSLHGNKSVSWDCTGLNQLTLFKEGIEALEAFYANRTEQR
ncbi:hypothetical protein MIDIC_110072 [Alphaproteobacteria bacterium]